MENKFYAVSGLVNAETLHVFSTRSGRDEFVERISNRGSNHYTLEGCRAATRAEAVKFMGGEKNFEEAKSYPSLNAAHAQ